jgi:molecular chaperone HscB
MSEYYRALEYEQMRLRLDPDDLRQRFYARSRLLHPDRFVRATAAEQAAALDASSVLNDAYRTLRDPVERAEHVLHEKGLDAKSNTAPPDLLEEVFELNEALEESDQEQLDAARARFEKLRDELDAGLDDHFARWDASGDNAALEAIRAQLNRRRYLTNLIATAAGERIQH